jgi:hypothetical protein
MLNHATNHTQHVVGHKITKMKKFIKISNCKKRFKEIIILLVIVFSISNSHGQLPSYLELYNPKIQGDYITAGGKVWNTQTQELIFSVEYETGLTSDIIYYSDDSVTYLHNQVDGELIAQIPGINYKYNSFSSYLWSYHNQEFRAYTESGNLLFYADNVIADVIFPYDNEMRYVRNNSLYSLNFTDVTEQFVSDFYGNFSSWFFDGGYFLTTLDTTLRLYHKNGTLIKFINNPIYTVGGTGEYFWITPTSNGSVKLYNVNNDDVTLYAGRKVIGTESTIGLLEFGHPVLSIIDLSVTPPTVSVHEGSGPYLESYDADADGNWTTGNNSGVVNYGSLTNTPTKLNVGKIRYMFGDKNGNFAIATSSGEVIMYELVDEEMVQIDSYAKDSDKVKISEDGAYIAIKGTASDAQFSTQDQSINIYETSTHTLVKNFYYNYFNEGGDHLFDFDFSKDAAKVIQRTAWGYKNYLSDVFSDESVLLNSDNIERLSFSPNSNIVTTSSHLTKLYQSGVITHILSPDVRGWINESSFVGNDGIDLQYNSSVYNIDGTPHSTFTLPEQYLLSSMTAISDFEIFTKRYWEPIYDVIDLTNGTILFTLNDVSQSVPVGPDHIVYIEDNALEIVNWRSSLSIDENYENSFNLKVYPNPATNSITIDVQNFEYADIRDMSGKLLINTNESNIDVSDLSIGIYMISINKGKYFFKMLKN